MCGIPSMGLFQNGGDGWEDACGQGICGMLGAWNAGRPEEAGGAVRFDVAGVAKAPSSANLRGESCAGSIAWAATSGVRGGLPRIRGAPPLQLPKLPRSLLFA